VDFALAPVFWPADRSFERGLARRARGSNRGKIPHHLQGVNGTDKNVIELYKTEADKISYQADKFEENVINTTAVRSQIRSVEILLDDPVLWVQVSKEGLYQPINSLFSPLRHCAERIGKF
jgi:hypothetical protein